MVNFAPLAAEIGPVVWAPQLIQVSRLGCVTTRHSSSGRQRNFAALNRGRHLYSTGRPSRWALAHILVVIILARIKLTRCGQSHGVVDNGRDGRVIVIIQVVSGSRSVVIAHHVTHIRVSCVVSAETRIFKIPRSIVSKNAAKLLTKTFRPTISRISMIKQLETELVLHDVHFACILLNKKRYTKKLKHVTSPPTLSQRHVDLHVWSYPRRSYIFQVSSKSIKGFWSPWGSKFAHSHYFGYWLLQQLALPCKP